MYLYQRELRAEYSGAVMNGHSKASQQTNFKHTQKHLI